MTVLIGRRLRRIDLPHRDLLALTIGGAGGQSVLVYRLDGSPRGAGVVDDRPRGDPANAFTQRLRKLVGGAVITDAKTGPGHRVVLTLRRGDGAKTLLLRPARDGGVWVLDEELRLLAAGPGGRSPIKAGTVVAEDVQAACDPLDDDALEARGPSLAEGVDANTLDAEKGALGKLLARTAKRLARRADKIAAEEARADEADPLRADAALILSHLHAYRDGADSLEVQDYGSSPPTRRTMPIDPALGAKGYADALFKRARRAERGGKMAAERRRLTEGECAKIVDLRRRLEDAEDATAVAALADEAAASGVRGARGAGTTKRRKPTHGRLPYRRFTGHGQRPILVGRGVADNDALTLRHSKPSDLWLHARGLRGAHVIVPLGRGESCPPELLIDAAILAAHFSAAAGEDRIEVQHTPRRHVRKPRGAAPGAVMVDRERVTLLRHEPARIARLLETEER
ncbi:MAG: hypothetical protein DRJ42_14415 [Deltaproteobacteria bacterium]|nr:MAG: hypothetical protein DRJ42_14415 [Deltaproteobacteria bacterium]